MSTLLKILKAIPPYLLVKITGVGRYKPDVEWSRTSWVHNAFRLCEQVFWRREGIRPDATSITWFDDDGARRTVQYSHSWENALFVLEQKIRQMFHGDWLPVRIWVPMMQTPQGIPMPAFPYLFAVTFDASSTTTSHTSTGSNRTLWSMFFTTGGDTVTNESTGGVGASKVNSIQRVDAANRWVSMWRTIAQPTGAQTITVTGGFALIASTSYTGCDQTTQPDNSSNTATAAATTLAISNTSTTNNALLVGGFIENNFTISAGAGTTQRADAGSGDGMYEASSLTSPAGSKTLTVTPTSSDNLAGVVAHIRPVAVATVNSNFLAFM